MPTDGPPRLPFRPAFFADEGGNPSEDNLLPTLESVSSEQIQTIYRTLFESAPDALLAIDRNGRILEVNAEAERRFGYSRVELIGESVEKLVPTRFREPDKRQKEVYEVTRRLCPINDGQDLVALRKDGSEFSVDIRLIPVPIGPHTLFYCIVRDSSERMKAREVAMRLEIEEALVLLSSKFINLPADQVDQEVVSGLRIMTEMLDADRATLGQVDPASGDLLTTHDWTRAGIPRFEVRLIRGTLPWIEERLLKGETLALGKLDDLPPEARRDREFIESIGVKSGLVIPFRIGGQTIGAIGIDCFREQRNWDEIIVSRVQVAADMLANALARKRADEEIRALKNRLENENIYLREEIKLEYSHCEIVGNSDAIRSVLKRAEQVAMTDSAVLILGETGTGKELIARAIHELSGRKQRSMVKVSCASLPATLIENELFGREKGAYTGALAREIGRFELADKSTIFLDEIGELPLELQSKLVRVLQEGEFERLGSSKTIREDVRIIAATNRNLPALIKEGRFREDLYYRLNVFPILVPPLRERREDIPALVWHFLADLTKRIGRKVEGVHASTMRDFQRYPWPGNVRELRNVIERNLILNVGPMFRAKPPALEENSHSALRRIDEVEAEYFRSVLQTTHWRVRGQGGAAEALGLKPTTLESRLKKLGIRRPND